MNIGQQVKIVKGSNKDSFAFITNIQKEEIGDGMKYELRNRGGKKIYNGNFSFFPQSFIEQYPNK